MMYIKKVNKGGSLLVTKNAPQEGKGILAGIFRWTGTVYHVPSLRYLAETSEASDDTADAINSYADALRVGDSISWAVETDEPVYYTQDRAGNDLPEPRKSTRLYANLDLDKLQDSIEGALAPAKPSRKAKV